MKAFVLSRYGSAALGDIAMRSAGANDVVIRVHAAGLNPVDYKTRDGKIRVIRNYPMPIAMGNELAGVVDAVGAQVTRFKVGDRVCARVDKTWMGALAELCPVDESLVSPLPARIDFVRAAALPLAGLTALQVLREELRVQALPAGARILITGGAGGVGTFAIQLARHFGLHVTTTASPRGRALVEQLGAHEVIDYTTTSLEAYAQQHGRSFDCAFDTVGGDATTGAMQNVKQGGAVVTIAALPEPNTARDLGLGAHIAALFWLISFKLRRQARANGVTYRYWFMKPNGAQLAELVALVDAGTLRVTLDRTFPFAQTAEAMAHLEQGRAKGKVVVTLP
jgi:NADPH:quinone reductase-like Zn-dependent oxidoreductase